VGAAAMNAPKTMMMFVALAICIHLSVANEALIKKDGKISPESIQNKTDSHRNYCYPLCPIDRKLFF